MMVQLLKALFGFALVSFAFSQSSEDDQISLNVRKGRSVTFPCDVASIENDEIFISGSWNIQNNTKETIAIMSTSQDFIQDPYKERASVDNVSYALTLTDIGLNDIGVYTCSITTSTRERSSAITLRVYASPELSVNVVPVVVSPPESSTRVTAAECYAIGGTMPLSIKWIDPITKETIASDSDRIVTPNSDDPQLTDVSLPLKIDANPFKENGKVYTCVVNDAGENDLTKDATIKLSAHPSLISFPEKRISMKVGKIRRFACEVSGYPVPVVTWYQGSTEIIKGEGGAMLRVSPQKLVDSPLMYSCNGENELGNVSNSFQLDVQAAPVIVSDTEEINETETLMPNQDTKSLLLSCQSISNPAATYTWLAISENVTKKILPSNQTRSGNVVKSTIEITEEIFAEKVTIICTASNKIGEDSHEFIIKSPQPQKAGSGWVVGVVLAVIMIIILLIGLAFCWTMTRRGKADLESGSKAEEGCVHRICLSCTMKTKDPAKENIEGQDNEQIEETKEEGTEEEKQKLTEAEEKPSEEEKESNSSENENITDDVPEKKKPRPKLGLPKCCWKNSKKQLKEDSVDDDKEAEVEEEKEKSGENGDADSGKGDTLIADKTQSKDT